MRIERSLAAGIIAAGAISFAAGAAEFTMKLGLATMNDSQHQWANWYKEAVEAKSGGRIEGKVFPRNQLGTIASQIEGLQLGTVEGFVSPADFYTGVDPRFGVFSIPLLFKSLAHAEKVMLDADLNKEMLALGDAKGVQVATVYPNAFAHYFGKQPLRTIDDFKGKKLRVNATPAERAKMRQFGATAVPMDLSEVIPGLQQGVIDGTMSGAAVYVNLKFNDIAKVLTEVNDTLIVSVGSVSKAWLNKLPADLRVIVVEEGRRLHGRVIAEARAVDEAMVKRWKAAGGELVPLSAPEQTRVRTLLAGIGEEVTKDSPAVNAFYKRMHATAQKY